jgi:DNA-binding NtrC family response regulator
MAVRLMLVDDDPFALEAVSHTLRHYLPAVTIETCVNPVSALRGLQAQSFAVVLTDFNMPGMNGLCLLRAARENGSDASFIVMTGDGTDDILTEGLRLGMFALMDKPLNRLALIALVQQAIECHRLRQEVAELRRTLLESGVEWGCLTRGLIAETDEVFQPPLPY